MQAETGITSAIVDGGYVGNESRKVSDDLGIGIIATAIRGKSLSENQLRTYDFIYDDKGLMTSCPAGHRPRSQNLCHEKGLRANFDPEICNGCPLRERCITNVSKQSARVVINNNRLWIDTRVELLKTEGYQRLCRLRPAVEGLMEKLKPKELNGRTRFRGMEKVGSRMILRAIGLNFRRYRSATLNYSPV